MTIARLMLFLLVFLCALNISFAQNVITANRIVPDSQIGTTDLFEYNLGPFNQLPATATVFAARLGVDIAGTGFISTHHMAQLSDASIVRNPVCEWQIKPSNDLGSSTYAIPSSSIVDLSGVTTITKTNLVVAVNLPLAENYNIQPFDVIVLQCKLKIVNPSFNWLNDSPFVQTVAFFNPTGLEVLRQSVTFNSQLALPRSPPIVSIDPASINFDLTTTELYFSIRLTGQIYTGAIFSTSIFGFSNLLTFQTHNCGFPTGLSQSSSAAHFDGHSLYLQFDIVRAGSIASPATFQCQIKFSTTSLLPRPRWANDLSENSLEFRGVLMAGPSLTYYQAPYAIARDLGIAQTTEVPVKAGDTFTLTLGTLTHYVLASFQYNFGTITPIQFQNSDNMLEGFDINGSHEHFLIADCLLPVLNLHLRLNLGPFSYTGPNSYQFTLPEDTPLCYPIRYYIVEASAGMPGLYDQPVASLHQSLIFVPKCETSSDNPNYVHSAKCASEQCGPTSGRCLCAEYSSFDGYFDSGDCTDELRCANQHCNDNSPKVYDTMTGNCVCTCPVDYKGMYRDCRVDTGIQLREIYPKATFELFGGTNALLETYKDPLTGNFLISPVKGISLDFGSLDDFIKAGYLNLQFLQISSSVRFSQGQVGYWVLLKGMDKTISDQLNPEDILGITLSQSGSGLSDRAPRFAPPPSGSIISVIENPFATITLNDSFGPKNRLILFVPTQPSSPANFNQLNLILSFAGKSTKFIQRQIPITAPFPTQLGSPPEISIYVISSLTVSDKKHAILRFQFLLTELPLQGSQLGFPSFGNIRYFEFINAACFFVTSDGEAFPVTITETNQVPVAEFHNYRFKSPNPKGQVHCAFYFEYVNFLNNNPSFDDQLNAFKSAKALIGMPTPNSVVNLPTSLKSSTLTTPISDGFEMYFIYDDSLPYLDYTVFLSNQANIKVPLGKGIPSGHKLLFLKIDNQNLKFSTSPSTFQLGDIVIVPIVNSPVVFPYCFGSMRSIESIESINVTDLCVAPSTCDLTTSLCSCLDVSGPGDFCEPSVCSLDCRGNGIPNSLCSKCLCEGFFTGNNCETCLLQCLHGGSFNNRCDKCSCPRRGYSGTFCECREIDFSLTFYGVPGELLKAFEADPETTGTSTTALEYMRSQLLHQEGSKNQLVLFDSLSIRQLTLENSPNGDTKQILKVHGVVTDNCAISGTKTNYPELQTKWIAFLESLRDKGIKFDDETIQLDVNYTLPDFICSDEVDRNCDGVLDSNHGSSHQFITIIAVLVLSLLFVII